MSKEDMMIRVVDGKARGVAFLEGETEIFLGVNSEGKSVITGNSPGKGGEVIMENVDVPITFEVVEKAMDVHRDYIELNKAIKEGIGCLSGDDEVDELLEEIR